MVLPAEAAGWTLDRGVHRLRTSFQWQNTMDRYFLNGERIPYFFDGQNRTRGLFLDYAYGVSDRLELSAQVSVFSIAFDDLSDDRTSNGIGDLFVTGRYNLVDGPLVVTVRGAVKFPTGEFVNDAEVVPIGQGQYDFETSVEVGRSLWPRPGYVTGSFGYRFRTDNAETQTAFGDELTWHAEAGTQIRGRLHGKILARGLYGRASRSFGLAIDTLKREIVYLEPGLRFELTTERGVSVSFPTTLRGRNWPAGPVVNLSFYQRF